MVESIKRIARHALDMNRWRYFARCLAGYGLATRWYCPNCGAQDSQKQQTKHLVTQLLRCENCRLLFRGPTDPPDFGKNFYQDAYQQGFTTDCPGDSELKSMLERAFRGTPKDFSEKIQLLQAIGVKPGATLLDFGASWGYGTWQFLQAGFQVTGYEPSRPRARYGQEKLAVQIIHDESELDALAPAQPFDAIFSSHVLEHVPKPTAIIESSRRWLRSGGYFIAFTPNGSAAYQKQNPQGYRNHWGMVHPNYIDVSFYEKAFFGWSTYITGTPIDKARLAAWDRKTNVTDRLDAWELLVIAQLH